MPAMPTSRRNVQRMRRGTSRRRQHHHDTRQGTCGKSSTATPNSRPATTRKAMSRPWPVNTQRPAAFYNQTSVGMCSGGTPHLAAAGAAAAAVDPDDADADDADDADSSKEEKAFSLPRAEAKAANVDRESANTES